MTASAGVYIGLCLLAVIRGCEKSDITKHMLIHQEPRHVCGVCQKTFRHAKNMELHMKRYTCVSSGLKLCVFCVYFCLFANVGCLLCVYVCLYLFAHISLYLCVSMSACIATCEALNSCSLPEKGGITVTSCSAVEVSSQRICFLCPCGMKARYHRAWGR